MHRTIKLGALTAFATLTVSLLAPGASGAPIAGRTGAPTASYIVQVEPNAGDLTAVLNGAVTPLGGRVDQVFTRAIHGAVVTLPVVAAGGLAATPGIRTVEPNGIVRLTQTTQTNPPWGLDRIDQRDRPLDQRYSFTSSGSGVDAYIIDTGIRVTHTDFAGRAVSGFDAIDGGAADDCHGHGTHVAGTTGGTTYGVAKGVRLVAVRVLNCAGSGSNAQVIAGIDWVIGNHAAGTAAVANMSLGGSANNATDTAIRNLHNDGVTVAVAAGNDAADACSSSPARAPEAITVAATDQNDAMASFSNGGTCVDIFAPGVSVTSAWSTSNSATNTISGTSMATPHVAGAAARYLQANPGSSPAAVASGLGAAASTGKVSGTARSCTLLVVLCRPATAANRLLYLAPAS
ncbi:MAG: S8 family peptidase [Microthrixaceae bacterium]